MQFQTRKPTGKPGFPMILLAGVEGSGKTWAAAQATGMDMIDRAFFIEVGESMADEYGAIPGARFEIVQHDGTIGQILSAVTWAAQQPATEGKVNMLIVDSISIIWEMIKDGLQHTANERAAHKARRYNKPMPKEDVQINMDLWNRGADLWSKLMTQCRNFPGPVVVTARLNNVVLMDDKGQPSKERDWKIEGHKSAPYSAQVVVQAREPRVWTLTKVATTSEMVQSQIGKVIPDFTVEMLLVGMGVDVNAQASTYVEPKQDNSLSDEADVPQQQRPQERPREYWNGGNAPIRTRDQWVEAFAERLLKAERTQDIDMLKQLGEYVQRHSDGQLVQMAQQTLNRMTANAPAPEVVGEVHEAEVVVEPSPA